MPDREHETIEVNTQVQKESSAPEEDPNGIGRLERAALQLAGRHTTSRRRAPDRSPLRHLEKHESFLQEAYTYFVQLSDEQESLSYAGEWLLDNFYVIQQAIRQIGQDMPPGYYRRLPQLDDPPLEGHPRIYDVAREIIVYSDGLLDMDRVTRFLNAYQQITPLTMGELWALPTMLRLGVVELLARIVAEIMNVEVAADRGDELPGTLPIPADVPNDTLVANSVLSLRTLANQDWKEFFESVSQVEEALCSDPAGIYPRMDFDTRDQYRKMVEELALDTDRTEREVAWEAVGLALEAYEPEMAGRSVYQLPRTVHVGYYLVGKGCAQLEARLGYHPSWDVRLQRWLLDHPTPAYLSAIGLLSTTILLAVLGYALNAGGSVLQTIGALLLAAQPASTVAVNLVNWFITLTVPPRVLPKLNFEEGVPASFSTAVVIPALLSSEDEVDALLQQLERHYLGNEDPNLYFALLTDFADAPEQHLPEDEPLLERVREGIHALNRKYPRREPGPFFLFHRHREWNPAENCWMGWERKRGKLVEFNCLLAGEENPFDIYIGDPEHLVGLRYVITLDADTILPHNGAHYLIGTLAHPLNRARFDPDGDRVIAGYTILQPRVELKPASANESLFTRIFSQDTGLDLYTQAVSDVYQDFFGEGIYVGKGIYDVAAFRRSLAERVPENALLSHDLFEGVHGRAALVTDIVLYESYPPSYLTFARRMHRWVRGDWQLLPWLFPRVPREGGGRLPNPLSVLDRWKIFDNLRRSLRAPVLLLLLVAGWVWLPGSPLVWTLFTLAATFVFPFTHLLGELIARIQERSWEGLASSLQLDLAHWLLRLIFLPYEAIILFDGILTTLVRVFVTHKRLLQWTTAAHTVRLFAQERKMAVIWGRMGVVALLVLGITLLVGVARPMALAVAAPLLVAWLLSPTIALWISRPIDYEPAPLDQDELRELRYLTRRTWLFFEQFVGPEDHWLPPDHFQEQPRGLVAHRTSPTNLGLMLVCNLAAYDMGYMSALTLILRLRPTFETMDRLEQYRGHLLNWYDTRRLTPLAPRYVSTVDSGNLAGCLLALRQGLLQLPQDPTPRWARWQGLLDTLDVLTEVLSTIQGKELQEAVGALRQHVDDIHAQVSDVRDAPARWAALVEHLNDEGRHKLDRLLMELVESGTRVLDAETLRSLRMWTQQVHQHLRHFQEELDMLAPWLGFLDRAPALFEETDEAGIREAWQALKDVLPAASTLGQVPEVCRVARQRLDELRTQLSGETAEAAVRWCEAFDEKLANSRLSSQSLLIGYRDIAEQAERNFTDMEFGFLFDKQRNVFRLGYNVTAGRLDNNHYDLLASESRIASLIAIAKGDVSQSHWLHMARPLTRVDSTRALLSWNGSMFEYLMPALLMHSYEGTLLNRTNEAVVQRQIDYARQHGVPWGISESGYYRFDASMNYQYRGFGVPGLGRKRGLADDLVITPYASLLALWVDPPSVVENIRRMSREGMMGFYGFYESIDYTESRLPLGQESAIVNSYMAHHQGMIMIALINYLLDEAIVRRFHADPRVQSVELLLQEQVPEKAPIETLPEQDVGAMREVEPRVELQPWHPPLDVDLPQVHFLSNGRYGLLITGAGSGYSSWEAFDLTRWRADTTLDDWGTWIYVQDLDTEEVWSVGSQPLGTPPDEVLFHAHKAEFRRRDHEISQMMEITVSPQDDVEIRRIQLTNHSDRTRHLRLTSYAEVILAPQAADRRHPAFNRLFIESEYLPELNGMLFRRRPRSAEESPLFMAHVLVVEQDQEVTGAHEGDRKRFLGRGRTVRAPAALVEGYGLSGTTGATLDPVMSLAQEVRLPPHGEVRLAYLTIAGDSRHDVLAAARRYRAFPAMARAFDQARAQSARELRQLRLDLDVEHIQQLLSALLYPYHGLRAGPETLAANEKDQSGLWPYAISGDYPILLVRVKNQEEAAIVHELLQAHAYWRNRNLKIDLVILNQRDVGYAQELHEHLQRLVKSTRGDEWLNRRGGIFLLNGGQMDDATQILLATAARVVLDGDAGPLSQQLLSLHRRPTRLPFFVPTRPDREEEDTPPLERPTDLQFDNGLGGFSADGREYVIYLEPGQGTPLPWINVVANPHFGFIVSEAGGGYSWAVNSGENRLTPWRNDPVTDPPGEALYLRDEETAHVWSPTPLPNPADAPYLVRHGAGYSIFEHHSHGLKQRLRLFAAPDAPVKFVQLRLENTWDRNRRLTATYYAPWVLGTTRAETQMFIVPEFHPDLNALMARNTYSAEFDRRVAFLATSKVIHGLTTDRMEFLGRMGSLHHPVALRRVGLSNTVRAGLDPCAAMQIHVELEPGERKEFFFLLGQGADREETLHFVEQYRDPEQVERAWEASTGFWEETLSAVTVDTPDPSMDLLLNRRLLYQSLACRVWGRSALYQSSGAFGFRDQLQDSMSLLHAVPEVARGHILRSARHQFEAGDVLHWWHPPSGRGVRTRITDDLLWLPFVTAHYVTTTGDTSILEERVPFVQGAPLEPDEEERYGHYETTEETYSLYEHCRRALEKGTTSGPHDLPLIGSGDWNDGFNRVGIEGRGESVWLGWFLYDTMRRFIPMCEHMGDEEQAEAYRRQMSDLQAALEESSWDGDWYIRAYYDDGSPLGSHENRECKIDSLAQSWSVLSGAGDPERAREAMASVVEWLVRPEERLIELFTPPFDTSVHDPGYIKGYPPGIRENGGQYTHAALWTVWALTELGDVERAGAFFRLLSPIYHAETPEQVEEYQVEPYAVAADVYSEPPHTGHGGWTWYTGSAGWMLRLGLEAILGLERVGDGLRFRPCIPPEWPGYRIDYRYGESVYRIEVENPEGAGKGVREVTLDGEVVPEGRVPLVDDGQTHTVHVTLGPA
jgi:cyclic beta-1,2-glucan synthetase